MLVVLAAGGFGVWKLTQKPSTPVVATAGDAGAVEEQVGYFVIDPQPSGARGSLTDEQGGVHPFGPTAHNGPNVVRRRVTANSKFKIHIELPGYNPYDTESTVLPNETLRISPTLSKASASLHVETTPSGAQVSFNGKLLGETPLTRENLDAKSGDLSITKAGYEPVKAKIALELGKTTEFKRELKELAKMGTVMIELTGSTQWAEVYFKGKSLGRNKTMSGVQALHVPVGKQQLKLVNPKNNKSKSITVDVTEAAQTIKVSLD